MLEDQIDSSSGVSLSLSPPLPSMLDVYEVFIIFLKLVNGFSIIRVLVVRQSWHLSGKKKKEKKNHPGWFKDYLI